MTRQRGRHLNRQRLHRLVRGQLLSSGFAASSSRASRPAASAAASSSAGSAPSLVILEMIPVKDSDAGVKRLRNSALHPLAFFAQVLANTLSCAIAEVVLHVCEPSFE